MAALPGDRAVPAAAGDRQGKRAVAVGFADLRPLQDVERLLAGLGNRQGAGYVHEFIVLRLAARYRDGMGPHRRVGSGEAVNGRLFCQVRFALTVYKPGDGIGQRRVCLPVFPALVVCRDRQRLLVYRHGNLR